MKKILITSFGIVALFMSCNKNNNTNPVPSIPAAQAAVQVTVNTITGKWQPVSVSGLNGEPEAMPNIFWYYIFNADSTYADYFSPQTQRNGTFQIGQEKSIIDGKTYSSISFDGSASQSLVTIKNDTLTISDNFTGGSKYFYVRLN